MYCCPPLFFRPRGPLTWLDPGAFGTLGVGGGFALGAKLCRPDAEVWIIYGDGSLGYSVAEFDTFTRHKVNWTGFLFISKQCIPLLAWFSGDFPPSWQKCPESGVFCRILGCVKTYEYCPLHKPLERKESKVLSLSRCHEAWEKPTMGHNQKNVPFCFFFSHF